MLRINKIDHLNLNVKSLEASKRFYKHLFGLEIKEEGRSASGLPYTIIGQPEGPYLCLYETDKPNNSDSPLNHFGVHVSDFDGILEKLDKLGIKYLYGGYVEYPQSRSVYVEDPSGLEIEISEVLGGGLN